MAVREFELAKGHGYADYLLFVDGKAVGVWRCPHFRTSLARNAVGVSSTSR